MAAMMRRKREPAKTKVVKTMDKSRPAVIKLPSLKYVLGVGNPPPFTLQKLYKVRALMD